MKQTCIRFFSFRPMAPSRSVVIVGGVAGGMSCATRLRRLDESAKITVVEKGPYVSYANCGIPYALGRVIESEAKLHVQTPEKLKSWFNIDVRTNTELLGIDRGERQVRVRERGSGSEETVPYDKLVLALGAEAFVPPIPGIEASHVFTLQTIPDLQKIDLFTLNHDCKHAVVIGGGFIGLEAAENLTLRGLHVTLLEALPHVMPVVDPDIAEPIHAELRRNGVQLVLNAKISQVVASSPERRGSIILQDHAEPIPADLVIVATGVRPRTALAVEAGLGISNGAVAVSGQMQTSDADIYAVGDMVSTADLVTGIDRPVGLAGPANRQGRMAADHICGRTVQYRGNLGTAIFKVFGQSVGLVGPSTAALARLGRKFEYVTVHPPDHAGYYPGAMLMMAKVAFEVPGGRLLGAQIVGASGVDKRIDVLATAIRAGMTVEDLEHLELAYAPPYGSAKDPVNMVGFVGGNLLRGDVRVVHAADLASGSVRPEDFQFVDVRSSDEFEEGHLAGAVNVPLGSLREHLGELRTDGKVLVYCRVGYRGYLAYRILAQNGFDVFNLDGGLKAVEEGGFPVPCEAGR